MSLFLLFAVEQCEEFLSYLNKFLGPQQFDYGCVCTFGVIKPYPK